jgi:FkbM family methyltransferase
LTTASLKSLVADLYRRLDRLQNDVEFVKNRVSSYLGAGTGLTYLVDETPIYINTNDYGCPANFINGGRYEEEYLTVLASFRRPDSVFLDIGANLGVFSLRLAPFLRRGRVLALEPNPAIRELLVRSVHLNGLKHLVSVFPFGASDADRQLVLSVPEGHAGGGSVAIPGAGAGGITVDVRRLDSAFADLSGFDIAKIDVEGHELSVVRGMLGLLRRSPRAVVLFEKLTPHSGIESELLAIFESCEMAIYRIDGTSLTRVDLEGFSSSGAYFLAVNPVAIQGETNRSFCVIYPADLHAIAAVERDGALVADAAIANGGLLFHGPYWFLRRGTYHVHVDGDVHSDMSLGIAEKFGYPVRDLVLSRKTCSFDLVIERDLTRFEVVGRARGGSSNFAIRAIRFTRIG